MSKLTVRGIEALRPKGFEYKVAIDRGLHLRVATDGRKTWHVRYVVRGRQIQARLPKAYGAAGDGLDVTSAGRQRERANPVARSRRDRLPGITRGAGAAAAAAKAAAQAAVETGARALRDTGSKTASAARMAIAACGKCSSETSSQRSAASRCAPSRIPTSSGYCVSWGVFGARREAPKSCSRYSDRCSAGPAGANRGDPCSRTGILQTLSSSGTSYLTDT